MAHSQIVADNLPGQTFSCQIVRHFDWNRTLSLCWHTAQQNLTLLCANWLQPGILFRDVFKNYPTTPPPRFSTNRFKELHFFDLSRWQPSLLAGFLRQTTPLLNLPQLLPANASSLNFGHVWIGVPHCSWCLSVTLSTLLTVPPCLKCSDLLYAGKCWICFV